MKRSTYLKYFKSTISSQIHKSGVVGYETQILA